jgi:hypothetical protein
MVGSVEEGGLDGAINSEGKVLISDLMNASQHQHDKILDQLIHRAIIEHAEDVHNNSGIGGGGQCNHHIGRAGWQ